MATSHHRSLLVTSIFSSPHHNVTNVENSKEMNLIVNIMWIVLLCGMIASFGVFQVMRYIILKRRSFEVSTQTSELVSIGLKKSVVGKISTRVLGSEVKILVTECTICLEDFVDGQCVRVLPHCNHEFHVGCIDKWFESHSSCPNCRNCLLDSVTSQVVVPQMVVDTPSENMV
ncbi:RING-H2 finger protein ATL77-like [Rutidosis leptorrhynchoides]|uniref:RING-H2 finger protein ATL77-like n=1 Tax=Rutidosis leptorrhynchoides TaxID=125765 RepID=UPI003A991E3B